MQKLTTPQTMAAPTMASTGSLSGTARCSRSMSARLSAVAGWCLLTATITFGDDLPVRSLPRDNLLVYRSPDGDVLPVRTPSDWRHRRQQIVAAFTAVAGNLPGVERRGDLAVRIIEEVDCGKYVRQLVEYSTGPDERTPAYLCIPKSATPQTPASGVLCLHPTDHKIGHGVVVGIGGKPHRQYASELAERGFVTIAPSYPRLANYQPDLEKHGWKSGTLKAVWDNLRGLDLFDSLDVVRHGEYATIGHSLGGHNSVYTALFDDRLQVVVSSCGLDQYVDYYGGAAKYWEPEQGWAQGRYIPQLTHYKGRLEQIPFDFSELIGALAPRTVFISAPTRDNNFRADSVDRIAAAARPVFELLGHGDRLQVIHPECDHDFPDEIREAAYQLIGDWSQAQAARPAGGTPGE